MTSLYYSSKYYIIYLRKSRSDDPTQTVEEVLAKHEAMLQEYAERELGGRIPEGNIYREVVSGESIAEREEIQKVLTRMQDPNCAGVLVVEPQRLSRGDLVDCGKLINWLQDTETMVYTPIMTYNLLNKMERKFFQDELMRGRDYLEYVCEIMARGRVASVKRGNILSGAPLGYVKVKNGKSSTLEFDEKWAPVVRLIFELYGRKRMSTRAIAAHLDAIGVPTLQGAPWNSTTVARILSNERYAGFVTYNKVMTMYVIEHGERVKKKIKLKADDPRIIRVKGNFEPLIDDELWALTREAFKNAPRTCESNKNLKNVLAGLIVCSHCGYALQLVPLKKGKDLQYSERYREPNLKPCFKSVKAERVVAALLEALEHAELPDLQAKAKSGAGASRAIQEGLIASLEKQLKEHQAQLSNIYDLREKDPESYPPDIFGERVGVVRGRIESCMQQLEAARESLPPEVDYDERVVTLTAAIQALKDPDADVSQTNYLLKRIIEKIVFTGTPRGTPRGENNFSLEVFLRL